MRFFLYYFFSSFFAIKLQTAQQVSKYKIFFLIYWYILIKLIIIVLPKNKKKMTKIKLLTKRLEKQLSQEEISDLIGMAQSTYSRKEKGITKITSAEWNKIAKVLGVEKEEIFEPAAVIMTGSNSFKNKENSRTDDLKEQINELLKENSELKERIKAIEIR